MAFGLDDALVSWLVASAGGSVLNALRDDPATRALRQVVGTAVDEAVAAVADDLDREQLEHLGSVLREHHVHVGGVSVSSVTDLQAALRAWTAALDRREFGGSGYLAGLGVDAARLGDELAARITDGIRERGRAGGPLAPLADWLWRAELSVDVGRIKEGLSQLYKGADRPASYRGGLPGVTPDFTGRQPVLDELAGRVRAHDPAGVVVAIHAVDGMPGVGKTELALCVAQQHRQSYPDGQYFIDLHGYTEGMAPTSPAAALEELLRQAGLPGQDIPADLVGRQDRWRAVMARKQALVVLDNALDADQVRPLLPRAAGCLVLITSRSVLRGLPGARTLRLDVLPRAEAVELFTRIAGSDRPLERQAVVTAVELVGRLPLAVRAIASQVGDSYSEHELAADLTRARDHAVLVAEGGPLGSEAGAAFDISLRRLDPSHRRAFSFLGIHPGPMLGTPQFAALAGVSVTEATSMLRALSGRNLITPHTGVGHRRYQQHDLLRDHARRYAGTHVRADERSTALAQLAAWYGLAMTLVEYLSDAEGAAISARPAVEGLELDGAGHAEEWVASEEDNLLALAEHASGRTGAAICIGYGRWLYRLYRHTSATLLYAAAARMYREIGDRAGEAGALQGLGESFLATGDILTADEHLKAALELHRRTGNQQGEADALVGLGRVRVETSSYGSADEDLRAALTLYRRAGNQRGEDDVLFWMGELERKSADMGIAGELFGRFDKAGVLLGLGMAALGSSEAAEEFRKALAIAREAGDEDLQAAALAGLGHVALIAHDDQAAADHYRAALELYRRDGDWYSRYKEAGALNDMGDIARAFGHHGAACGRWREALAIYLELGTSSAASAAALAAGLVRDKIERTCPE